MALVSPGVEVTIVDESFFVPAQAPTVPLLFVATADEKTQPDGTTPAAGTFEHDVVRTVTSLNQSTQLYGTPTFQTDSSGNQQHGDATNEYGLLALNSFLGIGNLAFVVRANVNLDNDIDNIRVVWDRKMAAASVVLTAAVTAFIDEFNDANGLVFSDPNFKVTVTATEFLSLARDATDPVFECFSFSSSEANFYDDNTVPSAATAGQHTVDMANSINVGQQIWDFERTINAASQIVDVGDAITGASATGLVDSLVASQDETNYDGTGSNGTFVGGTGHASTDVITMSNGATITVDLESSGVVTEFTVTTAGTPVASGVVLTQTSTTGSGVAFTLTAGVANLAGTSTYDLRVTVDAATSPQTVSLTGASAQTYADLIVEINADLTGARAELLGGNVRILSLVTTSVSAIRIQDGAGAGAVTPLLASLTDFVLVETATVGLTNPTGLVNDATNFQVDVAVDGAGATSLIVQGQNAQTFGDLITQLNNTLSGATIELFSNGNIRVFSDSAVLATSAIATTDVTLLAALVRPGLLTAAQDETSYDNVAPNGTFAGGTGHAASDVITMSNGATITVDNDATGVIDQFTVTTVGTVVTPGVALTQSSTTGSGINFTLTPESGNIVSAGFESLSVATVGGANPTGLANDTTVFTASVNVDGVPQAIQVTGSAVQTFTSLLTELNVDLTGATAVVGDGTTATNGVVVTNGDLAVVSDATGLTSTIVITDVDVFSTLNGFVALKTAVAGLPVDAALQIFGNGYDQPSTGTYNGLEGIASLWETNNLGSLVPGEFTAAEAAATLIAAADDYKFTVEFLNETSLGANDAARRTAVVTALAASINSNTEVRSENFEFNLILAPGYDEIVDELIALAVDINEEAFVIGDTPIEQDPDVTATWALTTERQSNTGVAYYYPWALQSNLDGVNVAGAPSGVALRTYAFSDDVSELWFAPAGTRRGIISGVSQLGYVTGTLGTATTFVEANLNLGQRDNLYKDLTNINPLVFFPGRGFLVWGQKTSSPDLSARNRVNVERLVRFIKRQLRKSLLSFVFEPNDTLTRDNVKALVDGFLGDLVIRRGLFDFATVVDEINNTPARIDRNELWVDVAIKPVKAAEFIFVPIRIVATDAEI